MMKTVNIEDVIIFHNKLIERTGGSNGIRDIGLIEKVVLKLKTRIGLRRVYRHGH